MAPCFFCCLVKTHLRINNSDLNHSSTGIPQDFPFPVWDLMDVSSAVVRSDVQEDLDIMRREMREVQRQ